jgi:hypothetical protein
MFDITENDVITVYEQLKDRYCLLLTNTLSVDDGFEMDCAILVAKAHRMVLWLYEYGGEFVLDVMNEAQTHGTHWHPNDVADAVADITEFMEGKSDYGMHPFRPV